LCVRGRAGNRQFCTPTLSIWSASVEVSGHGDLSLFGVERRSAEYRMILRLRAG
jgi:hypothetical protein